MPTILLNKIRIGGKAPKNIQKGGVDVKTVYKGSTLIYDTQKSSSTTNNFSFSYPSNYLPNTAGTTTPTITKGYSTTAVGYSGNTYNQGFTSVSSSVTFTATSFSSPAYGNGDAGFPKEDIWGSLNSSTGAVTYIHNRFSSARSVNITGKCTINGTSMTASQLLSQSSAPQIVEIRLHMSPHFYSNCGYFFNTNYSYSNFILPTYGMYTWNGSSDTHRYGLSEYPQFILYDSSGGLASQPIQSGTTIYINLGYRVNYYDSYTFSTIGSFTFEPNALNNYYFDVY